MRHRPVIMGLFVAQLVGHRRASSVIMPSRISAREDTGQILRRHRSRRRLPSTNVSMQQQMTEIVAPIPMSQAVSSAASGGGPRSGTNTGNMVLKLKPRDERKLSADEIIQRLRPKLQRCPASTAIMQNPPSIRVGGRLHKAAISSPCRAPTRRALSTCLPSC